MKMLGVNEIMALLGYKSTKAYELIKQLNKKLEEKGYLTVRGKVPEKYLLERFYTE